MGPSWVVSSIPHSLGAPPTGPFPGGPVEPPSVQCTPATRETRIHARNRELCLRESRPCSRLLHCIFPAPISSHQAFRGLSPESVCVPQKAPGMPVKFSKWSPGGPSYRIRWRRESSQQLPGRGHPPLLPGVGRWAGRSLWWGLGTCCLAASLGASVCLLGAALRSRLVSLRQCHVALRRHAAPQGSEIFPWQHPGQSCRVASSPSLSTAPACQAPAEAHLDILSSTFSGVRDTPSSSSLVHSSLTWWQLYENATSVLPRQPLGSRTFHCDTFSLSVTGQSVFCDYCPDGAGNKAPGGGCGHIGATVACFRPFSLT